MSFFVRTTLGIRGSVFNACGRMLWCRQKSADGRFQVRRRRKSRKQSLWHPGYSQKSTYWNLPWTSRVKFKGDMSLGLCNGNCTKSGTKADRFAKRKLSFLERKLMFNNLHCVSFFRSLKGRGYRITAVFSTLDEGLVKSCLYHFCLSVKYFSAQGMCSCLVGRLPGGNWLALI